MRFTLIILFLSSLTSFSLTAQTEREFCGTGIFESPSLEMWRQNRPDAHLRSVNDTFYLKVKIHLVGTDEGEGFYPLNSLFDSFCKLNKDMESSGIQLELNPEINYIAKSSYNEHSRSLGQLMMSQYNVPNHINSYIVADPNGNCGYYSPQRDAIALKKGCLGRNNTTWAHELGHYLSLPHTFNGWEGTDYEFGEVAPVRVGHNNVLVEKLDGSNCQIAGDKFCDTKADYLSFRWQCIGTTSQDSLVDPDTMAFLADGTNIMSYSNDECAEEFSMEQIDAMRFNIEFDRSNELSQTTLPLPVEFDEDEFIVYSGKDVEDLQFDDVTLRWSAIPNATHYLIQITEKSFFPAPPDYTLILTDSFINISLKEDTRYEWEVMGFNQRYTCSKFSDEYEFNATTVTSSANPIVSSSIQFFPNPIPSGESFSMKLTQQAKGDSYIEVFTLEGKSVYQRKMKAGSVGPVIHINNLTLQKGVYFVKYSDDRGFATQKLVVY